ncbi:hypothetical protein BDZ89DRAFT_1167599 [Hymenopellis radicata]|nr:hypothetical protein BDZ89DRAFT_1167599 [Hymenopellis radicata]
MSFEIDPKSVGTYLSGICNKLEDFFPDVRAARKSRLVAQTLAGCKRWRGKPVQRKQPLSRAHLQRASVHLSASSTHDDVLFVAMLYTGFGALLRLGEITQRTTLACETRENCRNAAQCSKSETATASSCRNNIIVMKRGHFDPLPIFYRYLASRDAAFPFNPWLWVRSDGTVPNRRWFIARLRILEPDPTFAGQSLRAGGATALAEDGVAPHLIQAAGRWSSETFQIYIRKNPMLLEAAIYGHRHIAN